MSNSSGRFANQPTWSLAAFRRIGLAMGARDTVSWPVAATSCDTRWEGAWRQLGSNCEAQQGSQLTRNSSRASNSVQFQCGPASQRRSLQVLPKPCLTLHRPPSRNLSRVIVLRLPHHLASDRRVDLAVCRWPGGIRSECQLGTEGTHRSGGQQDDLKHAAWSDRGRTHWLEKEARNRAAHSARCASPCPTVLQVGSQGWPVVAAAFGCGCDAENR